MLQSKLDLFSQSFFFNIGSSFKKKGTFFGTIYHHSSLVLILYLFYIDILYQYAANLLLPNFRSQNFISDKQVDMELNSDLIGFRFEYDSNQSIESLQHQKNQTYIVYITQFYQSSKENSVAFNLDIIDYTNPSLIGFKCFDFSKVSEYKFSLNTQDSLQTQINIFTYGCLDVDSIKIIIPDNCAKQTEIDNIINGINAVLRMKFFTSQFNTTSKEIQANYRNAYVYTVANQSILSRVKAQKQVTSVKTGLIIQSEKSFSSPIQQEQDNQLQTDDKLQKVLDYLVIVTLCYSQMSQYNKSKFNFHLFRKFLLK